MINSIKGRVIKIDEIDQNYLILEISRHVSQERIKVKKDFIRESNIVVGDIVELTPRRNDKHSFARGRLFVKGHLSSNGDTSYERSLSTEPSKRQALQAISEIRRFFREYLLKRGFIEVDVPLFSPSPSLTYGGLKVSPHNINHPLYLTSVATPYLRRLLVGGLQKVFCNIKNSRDDPSDNIHYPEFESMNIGCAYEDYTYLMGITEDMFRGSAELIERLFPQFQNRHLTNLKKKWKRLKFKDAALIQGVDLTRSLPDSETLEGILEKEIVPTLIKPTFLTEYPSSLFGAAKQIGTTRFKERAEIYVEGVEIGNISTFENNPAQLSNWYRARLNRKGESLDDYPNEKKHLTAITYGLPPCTTGALGLTRIYMVLLGSKNIKEVVPFSWI